MTRNEKMLLEHIRPVTDEDREKLPMFSYSRLEQYKNCPMSFKLKYIDEKVTEDTSLALELGSLCHYVLEMKGKMLKESCVVKYDILESILQDGVCDANIDSDKPTERFLGVKELRKKYFEEWGKKDASNGMSYDDKINLFWDRVVKSEMEDNDWSAEYFEHYFEFVFDDKAILHGFIDRIDMLNGMYRVVDYKTSKKTYDQSKLSTSLQFAIYGLAALLEFGQLPIEYQYRFVLLDERQNALSLGWEKRAVKHLSDLFNCIDMDNRTGEFIPSPSPLCHWCNYCKHNSRATKYRHECQYYSLWTPEKKTFEVNCKWGEVPNGGRKIIF